MGAHDKSSVLAMKTVRQDRGGSEEEHLAVGEPDGREGKAAS